MTTAVLLPQGRQRYYDNNGLPLAGGKLYTYAAGTSTPQAAFNDAAGTSPQTNPITLDAKGEAVIYWAGNYKVNLTDANDVQITGWPVDNIQSDPNGAAGILTTLNNFITNLASSAGSSLVGFLQAGAGAVLRTVQSKLRDTISVKDFGAVGDGVTDDTAALNLAYAAVTASGATIWWPNGKYKVSGPIFVKSKTTTVFAAGAYLAPVAIGSFTPITFPGHGAWGYAIFANVNFGAATLTDNNIFYDGVNAIPDAAWNGHYIMSRYVTNLRITNGYGDNGADYCSVLACAKVLVGDNYCDRASNCAYDFWDGCTDVIVRDNYALRNVSAAVNINAMGTYGENRASSNFKVTGNVFQSAGGTLAGTLIYVAPLNAGSSLQDIEIFDNSVDMNGGTGVNSPNGVTVQRTKNAQIGRNKVINVGAGSVPILVTADPSGVSDGCEIVNNRVVDSFIGAQSMIAAFGTNHYVDGNKAINSSAVGGNGIQVDDPSTIVRVNDMIGATVDVQNSHAGGGATTPAAQATWDRANSRWYFRQRMRTDVALSQLPDYAITATGTNLATAYAVKSAYSYFSTVAAGTGAALPDANVTLGEEKVIWNQGANTLTVYAQAGQTIGGAGSVTIASGAKARYVAVQNTLWIVS